jgi:hypothetical protein
MAVRVVSPVSKHTKITRDGLVNILNEAIKEVNEIHEQYDKFFVAEDGNPSHLQEIENKLQAISAKYIELFEGVTPTKVQAADDALAKIKAYHAELLEGENSIRGDIKDSQTKINAFYNELFSSSDGIEKDSGKKALINKAVKSITDFEALLDAETTGYKSQIEAAKADILVAHGNLFNKDKKSNKNKVELLDEQITSTHAFHDRVVNEFTPYIEGKQKEIDQVAVDIKNKESEVDSLLSKATIRTLGQAYTEAMHIYGDPVYGKYPEKGFFKKCKYFSVGIYKSVKHFFKFVGSYILFIGPLILIGVLFLANIKEVLGVDVPTGNIRFSGTEYIFYKLTIALPLLWVSWFGQRSISHRRRLFEEYNHKLRVVQMYMLFTSQENTYSLNEDTRKTLESTLLDTVARNPSEVYGKNETMIDKLIDIFANRKQKDDATSSPAQDKNPLISKAPIK